MTGGIFDELKNAFNRPNNGLIQLIVINIGVFVIAGILLVFSTLLGFEEVFNVIEKQFTIPPAFSEFIFRPWTLITYAFMHSFSSFFHILFNMLILYWFGKIFVEFLGSDRVISVYVLGALAGGVIYLLAYNFVPFYSEKIGTFPGMVGASAAVYAVAVAISTQMPNYTIHLLFFGPVRIKYIVAVYIFFSLLGSIGGNAGGNLAHLGGALMGFLYIKGLQNGMDLGLWVTQFIEGVGKLFNKNKIKVSYRSNEKEYQRSRTNYPPFSSSPKKESKSAVTQDEIDTILDKISESGYESLSKAEKEKLFNYSKK
ncbi:rhomboid family intramembrane serine protease [Peijinzhouia sedimentorum]